MPDWVSGYYITNAFSRRPDRCQGKDNVKYLLLVVEAQGEQEFGNIEDLEKELKPGFLSNYCRSEASDRKHMINVYFEKRAAGHKVNFWVYPGDCPAN